MKRIIWLTLLVWTLICAAVVSADDWDSWDDWGYPDYYGSTQPDYYQSAPSYYQADPSYYQADPSYYQADPSYNNWNGYDLSADPEWDAWMMGYDSESNPWGGNNYSYPQAPSTAVPPLDNSYLDGDRSLSDWSSDWFYQDNSWNMPDESGQILFDDFDWWFDNSSIPNAASVSSFVGHPQSYTLDCETRSAVDLAAFFGVNIAHSEFLNRLPKSDDPNLGFVGSYTGARGQIPPASYGVYQEPVAELLRDYGLNAVGVVGFNDDALKMQIASGRPVMVWVSGSTEVGHSVLYTPSNGRTTSVVPYQHTVVVIGYDAEGVTVQDGGNRYTRSWGTFDASWGTLGNRAIYVL